MEPFAPAPEPGPPAGPLLVDLYELTMAETYLRAGLADVPATFSLFSRKLPPGWGYLVAAGLGDALAFLEALRFAPADLAALEATGRVSPRLLDHLAGVRFRGSVRAVPEGTPVTAHEPILEVSGPLLVAQLVETAVLNLVHFATLAATKASRCVDAAGGRKVVDFGLRRAHGPEAGVLAARAAWIAGFAGTSNLLAGARYGMPVVGTMAHSLIQSFPDETAAFRAFARAYPDATVLLVDTYESREGIRRAAAVGRELAREGHRLVGVRLDSGDLDALSREARAALDAAGLEDASVMVSGGLDEHGIEALLAAGAPVDSFAVGSRVVTSADAPLLDMAYKLVQVDGRVTLKLSAGKATWPGPKQVLRHAATPLGAADVIATADEDLPEGMEPLLVEAMADGRRLVRESVEDARRRLARERERLARRHRKVSGDPLPAQFSPALVVLRDTAAAEATCHAAGRAA